MRRLLAVLLLLASTAACGDASHKVTAGDESTRTSSPAASQADVCVEPTDTYDYTSDTNHVGAQQGSMQQDAETVRQYGEAHPDDFTQVAFVNQPQVRLLGVFTANLDRHRAALLPQLQHPESFEVRQGLLTARDAEAIQKTIGDDPPFHGQWTSVSGLSGINGHAEAHFVATKEGLAAARAAHERWGRVLCTYVAGHPYPKGAWRDTSKCPTDPAPSDRNPQVKFVLALDKTTLSRGEEGTGTAHITNNGTTAVSVLTGSSIGANVTRPGSNAIVGSDGDGASDAMGREVNAAPGQTVDVPVRFGTNDCAPDSDYSLPTGTYVVSSYLKDFGRSDDVTITIAR